MSKLIDRRTLLTGLAAVIASPAIVRAASLDPIKGFKYNPILMGVDEGIDFVEVGFQLNFMVIYGENQQIDLNHPSLKGRQWRQGFLITPGVGHQTVHWLNAE